MAEGSVTIRLAKAASEFNVGVSTIIDFLAKKGYAIDSNPNTKLTAEMHSLLVKEFQPDKAAKDIAKSIEIEYQAQQKSVKQQEEKKTVAKEAPIVEKNENKETASTPVEITPEIPTTVKKEEPILKNEEPALVKTEEVPVSAPISEIVTEKPAENKDKEEKEKEQKTIQQKEEIEEEEKKEIEPAIIPQPEKDVEPTHEEEAESPQGPVVIGKIDLTQFDKKAKAKAKKENKKEKKTEEKGDKKVEVIEKEEKEIAETKLPEVKTIETSVVTDDIHIPDTQVEQINQTQEEPAQLTFEQPTLDGVYDKSATNFIETKFKKLEGPKILDKIVLPSAPKPDPKKSAGTSNTESEDSKAKKRKRKRLKNKATPVDPNVVTPTTTASPKPPHEGKKKPHKDKRHHVEIKPEVSDEDIQKQIKETLQRLSGTGKSKTSKHRREKRQAISQHLQEEFAKQEEEKKILKVTEFVTPNDLSVMMNIPVTNIIATCMAIGMFVSINQRLDAETISLLADEFGYKVEFVSADVQDAIESVDEEYDESTLEPRNPIVTVMGHVDHGKTSLLDYIRDSNVIAGEAGGITQHIGAYEVQLKDGRKITFLDTPGHEAFTAMRARGAQVTDIVIIVVAADDTVMPQTKEAINHAQAAGVPMVFAINKIDKPAANPEKIKEELSKMNILVEDWGGKYQSQEISAKKGINVEELLEKVLLEAELLDLKANPNANASGTVIESSLDKGRGYVAKLLVQSGTLSVGDFILAGSVYGKVKAMYNERNIPIKEAGPSAPVLLLGLAGAPQAGDKFKVMTDEREAKQIATKRQQLQREQGIRTQKHITLDEIGRRIAIGDFKELNIIVKADVDGSVEALADSLLKLSTPEVQVNVIHKSVGAITESDVLLASASNAVIVGFQVRPSLSARKLAEREEIDIRLYSIIYTAINEIKLAIEGMLAPDIEEKVTCNVEIRQVFRISKVGSIAGCMVLDGKITRNTRIRVIRDGIVIHTGSLGSLKRFKDDVKEVAAGYECGLNIDNFNDIKEGDIVEGYEEVEIKRKL